jgi:hypothetical protein
MTIFNATNNTVIPHSNESYGYFYKKDSYTVDEISNQVKLYLAIYSLKNDSWDNVDITEKIELNEADVELAFKKLFGSTATYQNESLTGDGCAYNGFKYDENQKKYSQNGLGCGGIYLSKYITKVISAKKYNYRLEITEKVAYVSDGQDVCDFYVYKTMEDAASNDNKLGNYVINDYNNYEADLISNYSDQLYSYKYTFKYDSENDNYYFYSVEKVK